MMEDDNIKYVCNLCEESCSLGLSGPLGSDELEYGGLLNVEAVGGYNSTPGNGSGTLDDMTVYKFSLCEFCLDWLFQQFKVPVSVREVMNDFLMQEDDTVDEAMARHDLIQLSKRPEPLPWRSAAQRVNEDEWRRFKEEFRTEYDRRALLRNFIK